MAPNIAARAVMFAHRTIARTAPAQVRNVRGQCYEELVSYGGEESASLPQDY